MIRVTTMLEKIRDKDRKDTPHVALSERVIKFICQNYMQFKKALK